MHSQICLLKIAQKPYAVCNTGLLGTFWSVFCQEEYLCGGEKMRLM